MTEKEFSNRVEQSSIELKSHALRLCLQNSDNAQDLMQETYLKAFRFLHLYKDDNFVGWLYTIMKNLHYNRATSKHEKQVITDFTDPQNQGYVGSIDYRDAGDFDDKLMASYNNMKDLYKAILMDYHIYDLSYEEIAQKYLMPIGTVRSSLHRARKKLRNNYLGVITKKTGRPVQFSKKAA